MKTLIKNIIGLPNFLLNYLVFSYKNVSYQKFPTIYGKIIISGNGKINFGKNVKINSDTTTNPVGLGGRCMFYATPNSIIRIGNNVGISTSLLYSRNEITIEDNVLIGGGCQILDNDFHSISYKTRILEGDKNVKASPVLIQEGAFIGTSSIILKGVTIGKHSIIAAGSVVAKSVPPNEIWGGNPAQFIKKITS